jgi:hypothetical protein
MAEEVEEDDKGEEREGKWEEEDEARERREREAKREGGRRRREGRGGGGRQGEGEGPFIFYSIANGQIYFAYLTDISQTPHERSKNFGLLSAGFSLALVLGPAFGGMSCSFSLLFSPSPFSSIVVFLFPPSS